MLRKALAGSLGMLEEVITEAARGETEEETIDPLGKHSKFNPGTHHYRAFVFHTRFTDHFSWRQTGNHTEFFFWSQSFHTLGICMW